MPCSRCARAYLTLVLVVWAARVGAVIEISGTLDEGAFKDFGGSVKGASIEPSDIAAMWMDSLTEDITALARVKLRFDVSSIPELGTHNNPIYYDEVNAGVRSPLGTLRLGRANDAQFGNSWKFDPWGNYDQIASPAWQFWDYNYYTTRTGYDGGDQDFGHVNRAMFYDSPVYAGLSAHFSGAPFRESSRDVYKTWNGAVTYFDHDVGLMVSRSRNGSGDTDRFFAASYSPGALSVMLAVDRSVIAQNLSLNVQHSDAMVYTAAVTYTIRHTVLKAGEGLLILDGARKSFTGLGVLQPLGSHAEAYASYGRLASRSDSSTAFGVGFNYNFKFHL